MGLFGRADDRLYIGATEILVPSRHEKLETLADRLASLARLAPPAGLTPARAVGTFSPLGPFFLLT
jgi:hypothetical protein